MNASPNWIVVGTQEAKASERRDWTFSPREAAGSREGFFLVQDPFNIRKGVVPLADTQFSAFAAGELFHFYIKGISGA
ncbi:hypothetical protein ABLN87_12395 [Ruegeria sp. SCPT10]|uniref:hypothetical protein n=1 Tax=Ruegeria sp. SCP10 TaxID=3141377 RepID=UPI00333609A3